MKKENNERFYFERITRALQDFAREKTVKMYLSLTCSGRSETASDERTKKSQKTANITKTYVRMTNERCATIGDDDDVRDDNDYDDATTSDKPLRREGPLSTATAATATGTHNPVVDGGDDYGGGGGGDTIIIITSAHVYGARSTHPPARLRRQCILHHNNNNDDGDDYNNKNLNKNNCIAYTLRVLIL